MEIIGAIMLVVAAFTWALTPAIISIAARKVYINIFAFTGWRMLMAGIISCILSTIYEDFPLGVNILDSNLIRGIFIGGVIGTIVGDGLFIYSVSRVGASRAVPLSYLFIIWTALYDYLKGYTTTLVVPIAVSAFTGVILISSGRTDDTRNNKSIVVDPPGIVAAILASIIWAVSIYEYQRALAVAGELTVATLRAFFIVVCLSPSMIKWKKIKHIWKETIATSLLGYVVGALAFLLALRLMEPSSVSLGLALTPLLSQLLAIKFAREKYSKKLVLGGLMITASFVFVNLS